MKYHKIITLKVEYRDNETWLKTEKDIKELMSMINNLDRTTTVLSIEQGANINGEI